MASVRISGAEHKYISDGIACNMREDGRSRDTYRPFTLSTGLISNTNGSARIVLNGTHVLVAVKADVVEIPQGSADQGSIKVSSCGTI
jgi:exosome complex component RRP42